MPVPKSICVSSIPSALMLTAPEDTLKCSVLNDAIPLFVTVASSPDIEPDDMSIPSPAVK